MTLVNSLLTNFLKVAALVVILLSIIYVSIVYGPSQREGRGGGSDGIPMAVCQQGSGSVSPAGGNFFRDLLWQAWLKP